MEKQQQAGLVARAAQPLPLYNVGLNYAGVSIKHVTFYQDFIVWQYFTPSFSGHYPSKTNKQKQYLFKKELFCHKCLIFDCDNNVKTDNQIGRDICCFYNLCSIVSMTFQN